MKIVRCDNCGKDIDPYTSHLEASWEGLVTVLGFSSKSHFCSRECISTFYEPLPSEVKTEPEARSQEY